MTIQELLHNFAIDVQEGMSDDQIGEQAEHLAKKIEDMVRKETLLDVRTFIGDLDYEDMQTKGINQWVDEFILSKGVKLD